jgi:hypothetical protein
VPALVYSVTGGTVSERGFKNFGGVRTNADAYKTFFHILASDRSVMRGEFIEPPLASLLPDPAQRLRGKLQRRSLSAVEPVVLQRLRTPDDEVELPPIPDTRRFLARVP